jgi:hypothetical protein
VPRATVTHSSVDLTGAVPVPHLVAASVKHASVLLVLAAVLFCPMDVPRWPARAFAALVSTDTVAPARVGGAAAGALGVALSWVLRLLQVLLIVFLAALAVVAPVRADFWADLGAYMTAYARALMGYPDSAEGVKRGLSFFVHGWQAWSFCGALPQGQVFPLYAMPHPFVKAFHDGGASMGINLGQGTDVSVGAGGAGRGGQRRDYVASDMFTVLADTRSRQGVVCGFLSQRQQFNCVAVNRAYDHLSVHIDCDGVVVDSSTAPAAAASGAGAGASRALQTDWFSIQLQNDLEEDPLRAYLELSGSYNEVHKMYRSGDSDGTAAAAGGGKGAKGKRKSSSSSSSSSKKKDAAVASVVAGAGTSGVENRVPAGWCSWYHFFEKVRGTSSSRGEPRPVGTHNFTHSPSRQNVISPCRSLSAT